MRKYLKIRAQIRPKMMKNWNFNEKVHRIRKTTQNRFSLFGKITRCWRSDSSAHFLKLRKYLKIRAQIRPKMMKNWIFNEKVHRISKTRTVFRFFARYYDAKEVIHKRISWNRENISKSGPTFRPKFMKIEI